VKAFVDESGNTGAHIYDEVQPVYSCAILWASSDAESKIDSEVDAVRDAHNIVDQMLEGPDGELKGSKLCSSRSGRKALLDISERCASHNIPVSFVVQHKRFMGSSVVIENGIDPFFNDEASQAWYNDALEKEQAAQLVFDAVSDSALSEWWDARRKGSREEFQSAHRHLVSKLRSSDLGEYQWLGDTLSHFRAGELWDSIRDDSGQTIMDFSPNSATFNCLLQMVDEYSSDFCNGNVVMTHDDQSEFQQEYQRYEKIMSGTISTEVLLSNGNTLKLGIPSVDMVTFDDSVKSKALQIADCFAAVARIVIQNQIKEDENPQELLSILSQCNRTCIQKAGRPSIFVIGPLKWQGPAFQLLMGSTA
jgi:hypothetical protein